VLQGHTACVVLVGRPALSSLLGVVAVGRGWIVRLSIPAHLVIRTAPCERMTRVEHDPKIARGVIGGTTLART
jgi:hypothetical protein